MRWIWPRRRHWNFAAPRTRAALERAKSAGHGGKYFPVLVKTLGS